MGREYTKPSLTRFYYTIVLWLYKAMDDEDRKVIIINRKRPGYISSAFVVHMKVSFRIYTNLHSNLHRSLHIVHVNVQIHVFVSYYFGEWCLPFARGFALWLWFSLHHGHDLPSSIQKRAKGRNLFLTLWFSTNNKTAPLLLFVVITWTH